ncbi:hypothetical protein V9T40_002543 [Parthenolecanium corni]|uniref:Anamorsin homolog n=1 Tax=Parthenolecanium corni TaxID=536013 RepID=A0AAN9TGV9_9HEMI
MNVITPLNCIKNTGTLTLAYHPTNDGSAIKQSAISSYFSLLHSGGLVYVLAHHNNYGVRKQLEQNLQVSGFINCSSNEVDSFQIFIGDSFVRSSADQNDLVLVECIKPNYEIGSAKKITLVDTTEKVDNVASVWKLDDEDEYIDADDLLNEDDVKKPDPSSLKVCGTTGKRKACKDCSCGLAEELEAEMKKDTSGAKSSCGSCYLGDAFRCASCPYLGMPAFKPGEKVQLNDQFLAPDI